MRFLISISLSVLSATLGGQAYAYDPATNAAVIELDSWLPDMDQSSREKLLTSFTHLQNMTGQKGIEEANKTSRQHLKSIDIFSPTGLASTDTDLSSAVKLDVNSGTSAITCGFTKSYSNTTESRFTENQFAISFSAPLDDGNGGNSSVVGTALSGDYEGKFSWSTVRGNPTIRPERQDFGDYVVKAEQACEATLSDGEDQDECDFSNSNQRALAFFPNMVRDEITTALENNNSPLWFGSLSGSLGSKSMDYMDPMTMASTPEQTNPYSIAGSIGLLPRRRGLYLGVGGVHKVTYEAAESETICAPAGMGEDPECETGIFAPMVKNTDFTAFAVTRYSEPNGLFGIEIIAGFDFEDNVFGVEAPIYFLKNETGNLTGGVRLAWDDKEDSNVELGVFFDAPMNLLSAVN